MPYILPGEQAQQPAGLGLRRSASSVQGLSHASSSSPAKSAKLLGRTVSTPHNLHAQAGSGDDDDQPASFVVVGPSGPAQNIAMTKRTPSITSGLCDLTQGSVEGFSPTWRSGFSKPERETNPEKGAPIDLFRWLSFVLRFSDADIQALRCCQRVDTKAAAEAIYQRLLEVKAIRKLLGLEKAEARVSRSGMLAKYISWALHLETAPAKDYCEALLRVAAVHQEPHMKTPIPREYLLVGLGVMQDGVLEELFTKVQEPDKLRAAVLAINKLMWIQAVFFTRPAVGSVAQSFHRSDVMSSWNFFAVWFLCGWTAVSSVRQMAIHRGASRRNSMLAELLALVAFLCLKLVFAHGVHRQRLTPRR
mmetsp:Transcript_258/g.878  ORF Transcript_258/g.878 Transcript_258/m.878 type:complete len:362 (+) Transcript_258:87-1172(+)